MRIQTLDPNIANQIAAGEVIERPASIVKELFENSFDAGATEITIEVMRGGHELIQVSDNGLGIHSEDLLLAIRRHSTSKITTAEDLMTIQTLGFRGEALASVAAVSRFKLISRAENSGSGFYIHTEGGNAIENVTPIAYTQGTRVEVRDVFYNTPARRKFLRTPKTEFIQIESIVQRLALSHFGCAIKLVHNQKTLLDLAAAKTSKMRDRRVRKILGTTFISEALSLDFSAAGMRLWGWAALPTYSRSQGDMQYFYLNGRLVRDKVLSHAVRSAYQDILFHGRHPAYVLYLECDPVTVDVNAHPSKQEVRLRDSRLVHDMIVHGLKDALQQVTPAVKIEESTVSDIDLVNISSDKSGEFPQGVLSQSMLPGISKERKQNFQPPSPTLIKEQMAAYSTLCPVTEGEQGSDNGDLKGQSVDVGQDKVGGSNEISRNDQKDEIFEFKQIPEDSGRSSTDLFNQNESEYPLGFALAHLHNIYILAQNKRGLIIVDAHAAHERILYEKMKAQLAQQGMQTQVLLIPIQLSLSPQEVRTWEQYQESLHKLGIITAALGPDTIVVRELPVLLKSRTVDILLRDLLADLETLDLSQRVENHLNTILGNIACRAAIKANQPLNIAEMNAILRDMEQTANSGFCNHGRPTWVQWRLQELDKHFLRGR